MTTIQAKFEKARYRQLFEDKFRAARYRQLFLRISMEAFREQKANAFKLKHQEIFERLRRRPRT